MSHELKSRLIGATVLISLTIIFLPMILEHEPLMVDRGKMMPIPKAPEEKFKSSLIRDEVPEEDPQSVTFDVSSETQQPTAAAEPAALPDEVIPVDQVVAVDAVPVTKPEPVKSKPVEEPAQLKPGPSAWVIQVGSFSNRDNAKKLVERLRKAGLDTMDPQAATVNGKQWYRVKVGPELDKRNAEKLLPKVKQVADLQGSVIRYP